MKLSLLIPTYNEQDIILTALDDIEKELANLCSETEIIIVDDGKDELPIIVSKNKTKYSFQNITIIRNAPPVGKGQSLVLGFQKANAPIVGFMDVDLSTPPKYIKNALTVLNENSFDIFIGSRKAAGSHVSREQFWVKDILGHFLGYIAKGIIFFRMRAYADTQCGFKFYKNAVARSLYRDLVAPDGLNDLEILIKANLHNYRVYEQGVQWVDLRESKRSLKRILFGELKAIVRIIWKYKIAAIFSRRMLPLNEKEVKS